VAVEICYDFAYNFHFLYSNHALLFQAELVHVMISMIACRGNVCAKSFLKSGDIEPFVSKVNPYFTQTIFQLIDPIHERYTPPVSHLIGGVAVFNCNDTVLFYCVLSKIYHFIHTDSKFRNCHHKTIAMHLTEIILSCFH